MFCESLILRVGTSLGRKCSLNSHILCGACFVHSATYFIRNRLSGECSVHADTSTRVGVLLSDTLGGEFRYNLISRGEEGGSYKLPRVNNFHR